MYSHLAKTMKNSYKSIYVESHIEVITVFNTDGPTDRREKKAAFTEYKALKSVEQYTHVKLNNCQGYTQIQKY
jgi:hypothetical protein